jgi:hypothetical protein
MRDHVVVARPNGPIELKHVKAIGSGLEVKSPLIRGQNIQIY